MTQRLGLTTRQRLALGWGLWRRDARPKQLAPPGDWRIWLLLCGRGFGKTRTGAEQVVKWALETPGVRIALVGATFDDGRDVMVEGDSGILQVLHRYGMREGTSKGGGTPPPGVYTWNRSLGQLVLPNGSRMDLYSGQKPRQLRGPQHHYAWCISEGEPVLTARGQVPIEQVCVGDLVWTRRGWRPVTGARAMGVKATVLVHTTEGTLRCTADHRIWADGLWQYAGSVQNGAILSSWTTSSPHPTLPTSTGTAGAGTETGATATTAIAKASCCTGPSGAPNMDPSRTDTRSTTRTTCAATTNSPTCACSPKPSTAATTPPSTPATSSWSSSSRRWWVRALARCGLSVNPATWCARGAVSPSRARACEPVSAVPPTLSTGTVVSVEPASATQTYDLTVDGAHEFVASGVLCHNCDELPHWQYPRATWKQVRFGLRLRHPADKSLPFRTRSIVTTTPLPIPIIRELMGRKDVHLTRGSTYENKANLDPEQLAELEADFKDTTEGRQELHGEVLDDVKGATVTRALVERARQPVEVPELDKLVVSVDPAVEDDPEVNDATGYCVAGVGLPVHPGAMHPDKPHLYLLLADQEWLEATMAMKQAALYWDAFDADRVTIEANNGGGYLPAVLHSVDEDTVGQRVPHKIVKAPSHAGKKERAKHLAALFEQGRVHIVGDNCKPLEDELTTWTDAKGQASPNVLDAAVWAALDMVPPLLRMGRKKAPAKLHG